MSLDITLRNNKCATCERENTVGDFNITHNLGEMAGKAGIYEALWRPYRLHKDYKPYGEGEYDAECNFEKFHPMYAKDIIPLLEKGLADLKARPGYFEQFSSSNGWGTYEHFVPFVKKVLVACRAYPEAQLEISR